MTEVTFLHEAEVELWDAVAYYEDKAAGLDLDFEVEIERSIQILGDLQSAGLFVKMALGGI